MNRSRRLLITSLSVLGLGAFALQAATAQAPDFSAGNWGGWGNNHAAGAVFAMTNDAEKNEVIAFQRGADGSLSSPDRYATGGRGSGGTIDPLGSQGSLTLSSDHSLLFAANAGSGNVSVFLVQRSRLLLLDKVASGGAAPVAVAQFHNLVYVLNAGAAGSLVGFRLDYGGELRRIKNSTVFLTGNDSGGASLSFSPDGQSLLITERVTNNIDSFKVNADGTLGPIVVNANPAPGTFSVAFAPNGKLIASETGVAGASNASATSTYTVGTDGKLTPISRSVPSLGDANCWSAFTPDGTKVYTSNAASGTIAGYNLAKDGTLTPIGPTIVGVNPAGSVNLDIAISADGKYLYSTNAGAGNVGIFGIEQDGTLKNLGQAGEFAKAAGFNGIAAY